MKNRDEILYFCEEFLRQSEIYRDAHTTPKTIAIGPKNLRLFSDNTTKLGNLISDAFLATGSDSADGELVVWNSFFGLKVPDIFWTRNYTHPTFEVPNLENSNFRVAIDRHQGFIYVFNKATLKGAIWTKDIHEVHMGSFITPFRIFISWFANTFDGEVVHASAVEINGCGLLLNGPSGSGKSTLAIYAGLHGAKILADDVVLIHGDNLYAIYSRCKLIKNRLSPSTSTLKRLPFEDFESQKEIIDLYSFGENFIKRSVLRALVFPIIAEMDVYKRIESATALRIFAPNTLAELFGGNAHNFFKLIKITKNYPSFRQGLSGDLAADLKTLTSIAAELN